MSNHHQGGCQKKSQSAQQSVHVFFITATLLTHETFTMLASLVVLLSCSLAVSLGNRDLLITVRNGMIQGKVMPVLDGEVRFFLGVPYAKPPLGNLRFKPPQPAEDWPGVWDATRYPNTCYQLPDKTFPGFWGTEMWNPNTPVSEDCLYLNVWVPRFRTPPSKPLPVLMWLYGGSFMKGSSSLDHYDGRYLAYTQNAIVVSMNYRVGALGLLALPNNNEIRGNAGLLDQRMAMQWVVDNIEAFGGDPETLMIFGESSASVCTGLHVLSPGSNVLFKRAILQSGVPTAFWSMLSAEELWKRSTKLGELLGCKQTDPAQLQDCMQAADVNDLVVQQNLVTTGGIPFEPIVDGVFLPDSVQALLNDKNNRKNEVLLGLVLNEGTFIVLYGFPGATDDPRLMSRKIYMYQLGMMFPTSKAVQDAVVSMYTGWSDLDNGAKNRDAVCEILGDTMFICPVQEFGKNYALSGGTTYMYYFTHRSSINPWPAWTGVMHGYEIEFVFGRPLNASLGYTPEEIDMSLRMMNVWATFARTGNPGIYGRQWPRFTPEGKEYLTLNTSPSVMKRQLKANRCHFWNVEVPELLMRGN